MGLALSIGRLQKTLAQPLTCQGVGLHSGQTTTVRVLPAMPDTGRYFVRVDLPDRPMVPATAEYVGQTTLSTELVQGEATVRTIEHLLAALWGAGVDNARIEIDGPEVPLLDGSAQLWTEAIAAAGVVPYPGLSGLPIESIFLAVPLSLHHSDQFVMAMPSPQLKFSYGIEFDLAAIGRQWHSWTPDTESFATQIAPARTFGLAHQIEQLQQAGLIKGGSLDNALVCGEDGWVNPPLRFDNEPVRHKMLDWIGDLSLVPNLPIAHYVAYKASHHWHTQLARQLVAQANAAQPNAAII